MPLFSTSWIAWRVTASGSSSFSLSSANSGACASFTVVRRGLVLLPPILPKMSPIEMAPMDAPGMLGSSIIGIVGPA